MKKILNLYVFILVFILLIFIVIGVISFYITIENTQIDLMNEISSVAISIVICFTLILLSFIAMTSMFLMKNMDMDKAETIADLNKQIEKLENAAKENAAKEYYSKEEKKKIQKEAKSEFLDKGKVEWRIDKTLAVLDKIKTTVTETTDKEGTKKRVKEEIPKIQLKLLVDNLKEELNLNLLDDSDNNKNQ